VPVFRYIYSFSAALSLYLNETQLFFTKMSRNCRFYGFSNTEMDIETAVSRSSDQNRTEILKVQTIKERYRCVQNWICKIDWL